MALFEFANNERKQCVLMRLPHYCCFRRRQVLFFWRTLQNSYRPVNLPTFSAVEIEMARSDSKKSSNAKAMRVQLALQNGFGDLALETACDKFDKQ
jgi:hypothetical protein